MPEQTANTKEIVVELTHREQTQLKRKTGEDLTKLIIGMMEAYVKTPPAWVGDDLDLDRSNIRTLLLEGLTHG
jgi:hypothetical protein